ncbi:hypothetical protein [Frankia sp. CiP1_Cm_nod1]
MADRLIGGDRRGGIEYGGIVYGGIVFPATATFGEVMRADTAPQHIRL